MSAFNDFVILYNTTFVYSVTFQYVSTPNLLWKNFKATSYIYWQLYWAIIADLSRFKNSINTLCRDLGPVSQKSLSPLAILSMEKTMVTKVISELKSVSRLKIFFQKLDPEEHRNCIESIYLVASNEMSFVTFHPYGLLKARGFHCFLRTKTCTNVLHCIGGYRSTLIYRRSRTSIGKYQGLVSVIR